MVTGILGPSYGISCGKRTIELLKTAMNSRHEGINVLCKALVDEHLCFTVALNNRNNTANVHSCHICMSCDVCMFAIATNLGGVELPQALMSPHCTREVLIKGTAGAAPERHRAHDAARRVSTIKYRRHTSSSYSQVSCRLSLLTRPIKQFSIGP